VVVTPGTLIIFSGLPASGKSTLAAQLASNLGATYLRIDTIEQGLRDICQISLIDGKGYELAHRIAQENLQVGNTVIADSVNPWGLTRKAWNNVAEEVGANCINVEVVCSNREEHKRRLESRAQSVPGLREPTWQEVLNRDYHPWSAGRLRIDTSNRNIEESFEELISILRNAGVALVL